MREKKKISGKGLNTPGKACWDSTIFYPIMRGQPISIKGQRETDRQKQRSKKGGRPQAVSVKQKLQRNRAL